LLKYWIAVESAGIAFGVKIGAGEFRLFVAGLHNAAPNQIVLFEPRTT